MISSIVITLVTEAGGSFSWAFCSKSTVPVAASISRALFAATVGPVPAAEAGSTGKSKLKTKRMQKNLRMVNPPKISWYNLCGVFCNYDKKAESAGATCGFCLLRKEERKNEKDEQESYCL